jgi:hypothetical protein
MRQADAEETLAIMKCRPVSVFGTGMSFCTWRSLQAHPDTPCSKDKETASSAWKQTVKMHPRSDSFGITKASQIGNSRRQAWPTLLVRSSPPDQQQYWRKSLAAATILHEDCRSFLHRSRLSSMSAMLSGGPLPTVPYQDSLDMRTMPLSDPLFLHAHVTLCNRRRL